MIELTNNEKGFSAVCEYYLVDRFGNHQKNGEFLYIVDLQIAEGYRRSGIIKQVIKQFLEKYPQLHYCYFRRGFKHPGKMYFHNRRQYEQLVKTKEEKDG